MNAKSKYRSLTGINQVVALSVSYERENLLARGLGLDHLKELLLRLARPLLRQGSNFAYGGHWVEGEDNFTYDLLRLVSAEQDEAEQRRAEQQLAAQRQAEGVGGAPNTPTPAPPVGRLFNHSAWPHYLSVTPAIEAQWIDCCRIVRVGPELAGITSAQAFPDQDIPADLNPQAFPPGALIQEAVCLSTMRRLAMDGMWLTIPDLPAPEIVPPVSARVVLGGKTRGYRGFMPGIFEETLLSLERGSPLYLLGGFGGATEVLARSLLVAPLPEELDETWQREHTPALAKLEDACAAHPLPSGMRNTSAALAALCQQLSLARGYLASKLNTGLDDVETRELLTTRDMRRAVTLVHLGLQRRGLMVGPEALEG